ncbi:c-type cytochrome biogenesis protein CcmI [Limnohabitans sp. 2KL-51]|uniref:c-type cytochrome biogenesis protein CcmI n=1 Tax=Limnohabitans sp. 2KL-51 TaxID=1977911 RepID=UPI000D386C63|nr:c-type cytochrome biogenesis protein CcmI [Limnohabitans sp. 2KL-51]PUE50086.1 c-type cytochrome biogenesis protein CcmI [Limnohabitans sp. 2KL-51]
MTELLMFLAVTLGMALCVAGVVVWVLLRQGPVVTSASQSQANVKVYREQILDLDREHANGHLSDAEWQQSRDELSVRLLQDTAVEDEPQLITQAQSWRTAVVIALVFPISALGLYIWLGAPEAISPMPPASALAEAATEQAAAPNLDQIVENLASKLQADPNNLEGWVLLGRTHRSIGNLDAALSAFDRALKLNADDELILARAEVLAAKNQGRFDGEPWRVIREVLQRDPQNYAALLLAGSASYANNRYADALEFWQRARLRLSADHPDVPNLIEAMSTVQAKLKNPASPSSTPAAQSAQGAVPAQGSAASGAAPAAAVASAAGGAASALNVSGQVRLSAALKSQTSPTDVVFVYAVPANGERMPLALLKTTVAQLPLSFTLDDSSAMLPDRKLSGASQVLVKARISKSGNAIPQSGDWEGSLGPVKVGATGLDLEIKTQRP